MWEMMEELNELCGTAEKKLKEVNEKIREAGGKITSADLDYLDKLTHMLKSIKTVEAMIEDGFSEASYGSYEGGSYGGSYRGSGSDRSMAGRSTRSSYHDSYEMSGRRDSMGRYARASRDTGTISQLRTLMNNAPDEETREELMRVIEKMEHM